ncbi:MAG: diguanylate cyclase, partial [Candidatus Thiodiazotropha sp.]
MKRSSDEEIKRMANPGQNPQTLYYITLDNFTDIRSITSIKASDALLLEIAGMLRTVTTHQDILARFGDHSFTILSAEQDRAQIEKISQRICDGIESKYLTESDMQPTCSIGVAFSSKDFTNGNDYITQAYHACEQARSQDGNNYFIADSQIVRGSDAPSG